MYICITIHTARCTVHGLSTMGQNSLSAPYELLLSFFNNLWTLNNESHPSRRCGGSARGAAGLRFPHGARRRHGPYRAELPGGMARAPRTARRRRTRPRPGDVRHDAPPVKLRSTALPPRSGALRWPGWRSSCSKSSRRFRSTNGFSPSRGFRSAPAPSHSRRTAKSRRPPPRAHRNLLLIRSAPPLAATPPGPAQGTALSAHEKAAKGGGARLRRNDISQNTIQ